MDPGRLFAGRPTRVWCRRRARPATATTTGKWNRPGRGGKSSRSTANAGALSSNITFAYLKVFQKQQRRHSSLGMLSLIESERRHTDNLTRTPRSCLRESRDTRPEERLLDQRRVKTNILRAANAVHFGAMTARRRNHRMAEDSGSAA